MTDFEGLLRQLTSHGVDFIIVGGIAANILGSSRTTVDLDVLYARDPANLRRLATALHPLSPYPRDAPQGLPFVCEVRTFELGLNFTFSTSMGDLDLLGEMSGVGTYNDTLPHTLAVHLLGFDVRCVDLPTLIQAKRAAGRPKDYESLAILEALWTRQRRFSPS